MGPGEHHTAAVIATSRTWKSVCGSRPWLGCYHLDHPGSLITLHTTRCSSSSIFVCVQTALAARKSEYYNNISQQRCTTESKRRAETTHKRLHSSHLIEDYKPFSFQKLLQVHHALSKVTRQGHMHVELLFSKPRPVTSKSQLTIEEGQRFN